MRLIEELKRQQVAEESYFQQHLIAEDTRRLERLQELAATQAHVDAFVTAGMKLGWTPEDRRTHELRWSLEPLLLAIHAAVRERASKDHTETEQTTLDDAVSARWQAFGSHRMDRLVGCLARVPRPADAPPP